MRCAMVVAVDEHFAIGKNGNLLWSLPKDMKRFKDITYGHHVLMGRKTYESIPTKFRPLPGRANIVISRTQQFEGCKSVATIDEAVAFAADCNERELMIIGGSEIYKQLFERTDKIYLTIVHHTFEADALLNGAYPNTNLVSCKKSAIKCCSHKVFEGLQSASVTAMVS
jgi:dihydrofolate reductase